MTKKLKIEFAPGCFDSFDGTQEELDGLMAEVIEMIESGEMFEHGEMLDLDNLSDEDQAIVEKLMNSSAGNDTRKLH